MKGFDAATPLTPETAANFKAAGYDFVFRYLVPASSAWKALTKDEADIIQAAGILIGSVYETTADRALSDYAGGVDDAKAAMEVAKEVGQPTGSAIYFAVDFQPTEAQLHTVIAYFAGVHDTLTGYYAGVYGNDVVVDAVRNSGNAAYKWQTYAWSGGRLTDCQVFQYKNSPDGADYDEDRTFGDAGLWGGGAVTSTVKPTAKLDPGVAFTIINTWMKKSWDDANNAGNADQSGYIRWLANQLREAAGIPDDADQ